MVLGDWYDQGSVLRVDARGWILESLPLAKAAQAEKLHVKS
jgi:UDP-2,3-diacylglucosamine hydrolase